MRNTFSMCAKCYAVIPAQVTGLNILSECPVHGEQVDIVEVHKGFLDTFGYQRIANTYQSVIVDITGKCNAKCDYCFYPTNKTGDKPVRDILVAARKHSGYNIWLSGGEPTCHGNLFDIVGSMPNFQLILTNGIKFADKKYLSEYAESARYDNRKYFPASISIQNITDAQSYALENIREINAKVFSAMFCVTKIEDVVQAFIIWNEYKDVIQNVRIRTPFNAWMQKNVKTLFLSKVYSWVKHIKPEFEPTMDFGGNSINSITLRHEGRYLTINCSPSISAIDLESMKCAPTMLADDGNVYAVPVALFINEGISRGFYMGAKV